MLFRYGRFVPFSLTCLFSTLLLNSMDYQQGADWKKYKQEYDQACDELNTAEANISKFGSEVYRLEHLLRKGKPNQAIISQISNNLDKGDANRQVKTCAILKKKTLSKLMQKAEGVERERQVALQREQEEFEQREQEDLQEALRQAELITQTEALIRAEYDRRCAARSAGQDSSSSSTPRHNSHPEDELGLLDLLDDLEYKGKPEQTQEEQTAEIKEQLAQSSTYSCQIM